MRVRGENNKEEIKGLGSWGSREGIEKRIVRKGGEWETDMKLEKKID